MTCPVPSQLARFVDGTSSESDRDTVETHLDRCSGCRETVSAAARDAHAAGPQRVGRYELLAPLGAGAMGVVYAAYDPALERKVAIKVLPLDTAHDPARRARLLREARALAKISDPNVVPVHDVGIADDRVFIAMELVEGDNLRAYLATPRTYAERVHVIAQAIRGLSAAHVAGVLHRDIKPENMFVGRDGRVRVGDFGLAAAEQVHALGSPVELDARLTRTGATLGTPAYMAPEQLRGGGATAATDQYALHLMAWEVLFEQRPARDPATLVLEPLVAPAGADPRLVAALRRGLADQPADRHAAIDELLGFLEPRRRTRRWRAIALGLAVVVVGAGVVLGTSHRAPVEPCEHEGELAGWSPVARVELASAFGRTGSPLAGDAFAGVTRALDRWASRYAEVAVATCRASTDPPRYAAQRSCLAGRREALATLLAVYRGADTAMVARATAGALVLDAPEMCGAPNPPQAIAGLGTVRALRRAGHYQDAMTAARALPVTDPDAAAAIELELGISSAALGTFDEARDHLSLAAARADAAHDDRLRAEALVQAVKVVGDHVVDLHESARLEAQARAAVERAGSPPLLHAALLEALGDVATRRGKLTDAAQLFDEAVKLQRAGTDEVALAGAIVAAAQVHAELGDPSGALTELDEAERLAIHALGPLHPNVATALIAELEPLALLHRFADAIAVGRRAIGIYDRVTVDPSILASALQNLAIVQQMADHSDDAIATLQRARPLLERAVGPDHADVGTLLLALGSIEKDSDKLDAAVANYQRVVEIWTKTLGVDSVELARPLTALAEIDLDRHQPAQAIPLLERAIKIRERAGANVPPKHLAHSKKLLAEAYAVLRKR